MKKKLSAFVCSFAALLILFTSLFGYTSARYSSSVTVNEPISYAKTAGTISIYEPQWIYEDYYNNGEAFPFAKDASQHVHYKIANTATVNGVAYKNEIETQFYIRVTAQTDADKQLFSSWSVCKYGTWGAVGSADDYTKNETLGAYGPFTLGVNAPNPEYLDVIVTYKDKGDLKGIRTLRVQMFSVRADGSEKIISQDDLRILATNESGHVDILLDYFSYGSSSPMANVSQTLNVATGTEIDFTDKDSLDSLGIKIPSGYSFAVDRSGGDIKLISYASSVALDWQKHYKFNVTGDFSKATPIQVHLIKNDSIPVLLQYWDRSKQNKDESFTQIEDTSQMLLIKKGSVIDFNDASTLAAAGIEMPDPSVYKYIAAHCNVPRWWHDANHYFQDRYNVPTDPVVAIAVLDVYVAPVAMRNGIEAVFNSLNGTAVTVKATENASGLTSFVYNGVTCAFSADGKITFTLADLKKMFGDNSYNSFEVGIKNGDSIITVGRTAANVNGSVVITDSITVDYFKVYQGNTSSSTGYCLANPKMQLYIKTWGIFAG